MEDVRSPPHGFKVVPVTTPLSRRRGAVVPSPGPSPVPSVVTDTARVICSTISMEKVSIMNARWTLLGLCLVMAGLASTLSAAPSKSALGIGQSTIATSCCDRGEACCLAQEVCCTLTSSTTAAVAFVVPTLKSTAAAACCSGCEAGCDCCQADVCVCADCCCVGGACGMACH